MRDFDAFTFTISKKDPIRVRELERSDIKLYWQTAEAYVLELTAAKEASDRAAKKHAIPSRHGRN